MASVITRAQTELSWAKYMKNEKADIVGQMHKRQIRFLGARATSFLMLWFAQTKCHTYEVHFFLIEQTKIPISS